jgi:hypothetical protein
MKLYEIAVKSLKSLMMTYFMAWTIFIVLLSGTLSHAADIAGIWLARNPSDGSVFLYFGDADDFFIDAETSWIQGTYTRQSDATTGQLNLYIQDGSNSDDVGKTITYAYGIQDNLLTLYGTDQGENNAPTLLASVDQVGSSAFIGINTDANHENDKDDNDTNWYVYASCFVMSIMDE